MKTSRAPAIVFALCSLLGAGAATAQPAWQTAVEQSLGRGEAQGQGVFEVEAPRSDLKIQRAGVRLEPGLDFTDELRFMPTPGGVMFMGEIVLTEDEINPVIARLQARGFQVAALHNHILELSPRIRWVHFSAMGDAGQIARSVRYALAASRTPLPAKPDASPKKAPDLNSAAIEQILGRKGKPKDGLLTFSVPIGARVTMDGQDMPAEMGAATDLTFQPTGGGRAIATGELPLTADKVTPAIRALQAGGLQVQAIHNHMLTEQPRLFFVHFWGDGEATTIARGLKAAIDLAAGG